MTTDILFDSGTGNILIRNGELVIGGSTDQHTNDLIVCDKGDYKHNPLRGVGVQRYINEENNVSGLMAGIRAELAADGQNVESVTLQAGGSLIVQTAYPS